MLQISDGVVTLWYHKQHNFFRPALQVLERIFHLKCDLSKPVDPIIWDLFILGSAPFANHVKEPGSMLTHVCPLALAALAEPGGCSDLAKELQFYTTDSLTNP